MKTLKTTISNHAQIIAFIAMALILSVTFITMVLNYGFKAW